MGARGAVIFGVLFALSFVVLAPSALSRKRFTARFLFKTDFAVALHMQSVEDGHAAAPQSSCQIDHTWNPLHLSYFHPRRGQGRITCLLSTAVLFLLETVLPRSEGERG